MPTIRPIALLLVLAAMGCSSDDTVDLQVSPAADNSGKGTVSGADVLLCKVSGSQVTGVCNVTLDRSGSLNLTAEPEDGSLFGGWSGDCSGTATCSVNLSRDHAVQALFVRQDGVIVTNASISAGSVLITSAPSGIACVISPAGAHPGGDGGDCSASFPAGTYVEFSATPEQNTVFDGWSGDCRGASCTLFMATSRTLSALAHRIFPPFTMTFRVPADNQGSGVVTSAPAGINCVVAAAVTSGTCSAQFSGVEFVELLATPASGSAFAWWYTGYCEDQPSCSFGSFGPVDVRARFDLVP